MANNLKPYVMLKSKDLIIGGGDQAHLFDFSEYDSEKNQLKGISQDSICGQVTKGKDGYVLHGATYSEALRIKIAMAQSNQDICGQCVGRLYS
jgi:hypothetical protein